MNRVLIVGFAVALLGGMAWVHSAQEAKKDTDKGGSKPQEKAPTVAKKDAAKPLSLVTKLASRANFDGYDDPRTTLQDALDNLSDKFDMRLERDEMALKSAVG